MRDELPKRPWKRECGILNLDSHRGPGSHWTCYIIEGEYKEYFDSFGNLPPPFELQKYLGGDIWYNQKAYQTYNTVNCGHLCLLFLYKKYNQ